jgi:hypothetical protein
VDDLMAFVTARLDEDEEAYRHLTGQWGHAPEEHMYACTDGCLEWARDGDRLPNHHNSWMLVLDPARVLREVEAGRRILARHQPDGFGCQYCADGGHNSDWGCADLADLLARWADHPEYRPEWKP